MSRSEEIAEFVEDSGGIASAAQIAKAGFLPGSISYALESGAIDKLTRGVYCRPKSSMTSSQRYPTGGANACYRMEARCTRPAFPTGFPPQSMSPSHAATTRVALTQEYPDTKIHSLSPELYELGIVKAKSPGGGTVKVYCAERAVADLISQRVSEGADPQLVRDAVAGYFKRKGADLPKLARMCSALGVEKEFRSIWRCSHDERRCKPQGQN